MPFIPLGPGCVATVSSSAGQRSSLALGRSDRRRGSRREPQGLMLAGVLGPGVSSSESSSAAGLGRQRGVGRCCTALWTKCKTETFFWPALIARPENFPIRDSCVQFCTGNSVKFVSPRAFRYCFFFSNFTLPQSMEQGTCLTQEIKQFLAYPS